MLTEESYMLAIYAYIGAAAMVALILAWWLLRRWPNFWTLLIVMLSAALLLTPAYPQPGVETMAPALIVAGFELLLNGPEAAQHAIKPLSIACAVALGAAVLLRLLVVRPRRSAHTDEQGATDQEPDPVV
ncbi:hypothetical protein A3709_12925 [Halioglobus sp. HI00S01]|uniref:hypothetical protein n=1 Tax=Halioglobus sp. HI00S01 TaxID=1822214 RepID=UPI0007C3355A|nr:hypothetical protein [Halioglobus sp. HI00S01]KZX60193.1 hypothetical protein A3709_12925 [Halioglobus sp. HI00S01]